MTQTTKNSVKILLESAEKKDTRFIHPDYVKGCRNNQNIASLLDYFVYEASKEAPDESRKVVTITREHKDILEALAKNNCNICQKSLDRYIDLLNAWNMVRSVRYKKDYTVDFAAIQQAIDNPPPIQPRKKAVRRARNQSSRLQEKSRQLEESRNVTTFTEVDRETAEKVDNLSAEVVMLQEKVVMLQEKCRKLSEISRNITTLQHAFETLVSFVQEHFSNPPLITISNIPLITSIDSVAVSQAQHNAALSPALEKVESISLSAENPTQQETATSDTESHQSTVQPVPSNTPPFTTDPHPAHPSQDSVFPPTTTVQPAMSENPTTDTTPAEIASHGDSDAQQHATPGETEQPAQKPARKRTVKKAAQPVEPAAPEPDISHLSEDEQKVYAMLRAEDKAKYLEYAPEKRQVCTNWFASYGFVLPMDITKKFDECLDRLVRLHPSPEDFSKSRNEIKKRDNEKIPEKRFFKKRNPRIWDVVRDIESLQDIVDAAEKMTKTPSSTGMNRDEACKLAHDIVQQGKQFGYVIQAQAVTSKKDPNMWIVRVKWENEDGFTIPAIKSLAHWQGEFEDMHKALSYVPRGMMEAQ